MSRELPEKPNLEYLKKEAKELLRGMREDVPEGYRKFTQEYFKRLTEAQKAKP